MTDDIVTRLREKYSGQLPICSEAADEIERLRNENQYLKSLVVQSIPAEAQKEMLSMKETIYKLSAELAFIKNIQQAVNND